jgi:hypothetical protein
MNAERINVLLEESLSTHAELLKAASEGEHNVDLPELAEKACDLIEKLRAATAQLQAQNSVMQTFVGRVSELRMWDYDDDEGNRYQECDEPDDGYGDSHDALMGLIEMSRDLVEDKLPTIETVSEIVNQVANAALNARLEGQSVAINRSLPSVSVKTSGDEEYFFQEHEAEQLIDRAQKAIDELGSESQPVLDIEDYILYLAQGW